MLLASIYANILTVNETRLDKSRHDFGVEIPGYDIVRLHRNRNGGGVAMYIRKNKSYINRQDLASISCSRTSLY